MQINGPQTQASQFMRAAKPVAGTQPVQQSNIESMTPQSHHYGPVSQLINSKYLHELRKDIRKVIKGRRLKQILAYDYDEDEFDNLPPSLQNLIKFDRTISSAEILQFIESFDLSHEITFRDYAFDRIKFRALFEALGDLLDVEMQAGPTTFVSLSDDFEVKRKVKEIFTNLKNKIKDKLRLKPGKRQILVEEEEQNDEYGESV
ncbi:MAG: hypothetical protein OXU45_05525 [Candidatus Melainabacteria bacterium]|nr:hypothetical protein [Candidatus Melainabacteria bacterium]